MGANSREEALSEFQARQHNVKQALGRCLMMRLERNFWLLIDGVELQAVDMLAKETVGTKRGSDEPHKHKRFVPDAAAFAASDSSCL
jgi:hypothetical protein